MNNYDYEYNQYKQNNPPVAIGAMVLSRRTPEIGFGLVEYVQWSLAANDWMIGVKFRFPCERDGFIHTATASQLIIDRDQIRQQIRRVQ